MILCAAVENRRPDGPIPARPNRAQVVLWTVLLLVSIPLSLRGYRHIQVGAWWDDAYYVVHSESLVRADRYGLVNVPGDQPGTPVFPFGYPLLLTPFVRLLPGNLDSIKILSLAATLLNATLLFWGWHWLSRRSHWWGLATTALVLLSPLTIRHTQAVMSEPIFTTLCLAALFLTERAVRGRPDRGWALWMGLFLLAAVCTRTLGAVLVAAVFAYVLIAKRRLWKQLLLTGLIMGILAGLIVALTPIPPSGILPIRYLQERNASILVGLAAGVTAVDPGDFASAEYLRDEGAQAGRESVDAQALLGDILSRAKVHLLRDLPGIVLPYGTGATTRSFGEQAEVPWLWQIVGLLALGLILTGFFRWFAEQGLCVAWLFSIPYLSVLLLWSWVGGRLLYPIQLQIFFSFLLGIEGALTGAAGLFKGADQRKAVRSMLVPLILALLLVTVYRDWRLPDTRPIRGDLAARTAWLRANSLPGEVLMTEEPVRDYLYSGRRTVPQPCVLASKEELKGYLGSQGVDYILIAPRYPQERGVAPAYSEETDRLRSLLEELSAEGAVEHVHSDRDLIRVFQVRSGE